MENGRNNTGILAILFDLDNTLIPTRKADKLACNKLAQILWEKWAVPVDVAAAACKSYLRTFRKCPENLSMTLDAWRRLLWTQALGDQYNKLTGDAYETWLQLRFDYLSLTPEIVALLQKLHQHYFIGLITNGTSRAQWEKIERLHLRTLFDVILVSGDLPWEKPHHKIFHTACQYLGVAPQQCLMVGDKLETDIQGAVDANLGATVWLPLNYSVDSIMDVYPSPDYVIEHISEITNILPKNPKERRFRNIGEGLLKPKGISLPDFEDSNSNSSDGM